MKLELHKSGKDWLSLDGWEYDQKQGMIIFWLNPYNQIKYNCGHYTVEQLTQWLKDDGPVINKLAEN